MSAYIDIIKPKNNSLFASLGKATVGEGDRYTLVSPNGKPMPPPDPNITRRNCKVLGSGGFGAVVLAHDHHGIPRAIKFIEPSPQDETITSSQSSNQIVKEFVIPNLSVFKHVIPVIDYGIVDAVFDRDTPNQVTSQLAFYVSPYVDGTNLSEFAESLREHWSAIADDSQLRAALRDAILGILTDVLAGVKELHGSQIAHMDIKPSNIMIYPRFGAIEELRHLHNGKGAGNGFAKEFRAFIIDLGGAKDMRKPPSKTSIGRTRCTYTRVFFPTTELLTKLRVVVADDYLFKRTALMQHWQSIDLHCLGRTIQWLFIDQLRKKRPDVEDRLGLAEREAEKEAFWKSVIGPDFEVLEAITDRMLASHPHQYATAKDAASALQTIPQTRAESILNSDILTDRQPGLRIRVGRDFVKISTPYDRIVNHPVFQQLKLRNQLAFVSEIFPDATHNRFSHALRTFHITKQILFGLNKKPVFRYLFYRKDIEQLLAAALVHDIGHYPFAHSIEDLRKMGDLSGESALSSVLHDQEVATARMEEIVPGYGSIAAILEEHCLSLQEVVYMFQKGAKSRPESVLNVSRDIISGVVDVDRIAYLVQDSERTGVPFGGAIDIGTLIESLTIRLIKDQQGKESAALAVQELGVPAIEGVLLGVYWMYRCVYWRHTNRAFMAAVKHVMYDLLSTGSMLFADYLNDTAKMTDVEALNYLKLRYDKDVKRADKNCFNPLDNLVQAKRIGYQRVVALTMEGENASTYRKIVNNVSGKALKHLAEAIAAQCLPANARVRRGEILIDVPLKSRLDVATGKGPVVETQAESGRKQQIYVETQWPMTKRRRDWKELSEYSPLVRRIEGLEAEGGLKIRVFLARAVAERLNPTERIRLEEDATRCLIQACAQWGEAVPNRGRRI